MRRSIDDDDDENSRINRRHNNIPAYKKKALFRAAYVSFYNNCFYDAA